ncbi:hypothetical protein ERJ75_000271200 [Trypanosoma vivax]|uniref:Uncharacterized protein n=1 Tax=Trypanosoma vivax (strain Y486) TaxID=1055687 RepID=G0U5G3_TRYVY|nr:hypothetical protein TRVL_05920 [Trypanosoma vivax]KAH8618463.1 hypothetical protein ERJ75_000271200 [Trypanosoma vivax]CCC51113.1 conserved hypothetical protein [Trypanosoma vivax Y486]
MRRRPFYFGALHRSLPYSSRRFVSPDPEEESRENVLRDKVVKGYRGLRFQGISDFRYAHFATEGISASSAALEGKTENKPDSTDGENSSKVNEVDLPMLFAGASLVLLSLMMLHKRYSTDGSTVSLPSWVGSLETRANHVLFVVQYDAKQREQMQNEYLIFRKTNPFVPFFQWLALHYPDYGHGLQFNYDVAMNTLFQWLSDKSKHESFALASAIQIATRSRGISSFQRLDNFIGSLGAVQPNGNTTLSIAPCYSQPRSALGDPYFVTTDTGIQNIAHTNLTEQHGSVPF